MKIEEGNSLRDLTLASPDRLLEVIRVLLETWAYLSTSAIVWR
jgi:hypothetical protein